VTYDVVVSVENSDLSLKPGMTAATAIVTESREDVTRVPNQALRYRPGNLSAAQLPKPADGQARIWVLRAASRPQYPSSSGSMTTATRRS